MLLRASGDVVREELHALASICRNRVQRDVRAVVLEIHQVLGDGEVDERDCHQHELRLLREALCHLHGLE